MPGEADKSAPVPRPRIVALAVAGYFPILGLLLLASEIFALDLRAGEFLYSRATG
jgi:hypothetical protein